MSSAPPTKETAPPVDEVPEKITRQDGVKEPNKPKTEKELERERKKAEKAAKFAAKKAKQPAPSEKAEKKEKPKKAAAQEFVYVEETPAGEKKILKPLDDPAYAAYNPDVVESAWYSWWEKEKFFEPELVDGKPKPEGTFVIPAPPPNVTGALHIGHALTVALQDTLIRWNRMLGKTVLFLPGFDHAGISTQSVVEKNLWVREKKTRHDFSREDFVKLVWEWKEDYHSRIKSQLKRMGTSYDWSREAFTLDDNLTAAVQETFVRLFEEGIIYRANRLVNWVTAMNTTVSNLETEELELKDRTLISVPGYERKVEFGVLTSFAYEIEGSKERLVVATTRPETMVGDTAIAVHPDDKRYKHLIGKVALHPFIPGRRMPVVGDDYVEMDFGTGAVKITPAHDQNDYDIGKRHNLEFINILNDDGTLNEKSGEFSGMKRFDARYKIVERLKELGLFVGTEPNPMKIRLCAKSKDVIEPLMKPQWWVSQKDMADGALKAVRDGKIKINPDVSARDFEAWMTNIQDWCISRQLWWGHRAPAYFVKFEGETKYDYSDGSMWVAAKSMEEAKEKAAKKFPGKKFEIEQDEDVLDTWFSSGLWPFSTLGWPRTENNADMANFYPTSLLETGWDILFFWVARMVMLGVHMTGEVPFNEVYCHSLVRDSDGRKMSKSLGNVIDPLDIIQGQSLQGLHDKLGLGNLPPSEVAKATKYQQTAFPQGMPQCGSDAMRFALAAYTTGGRDIQLDIKVVHGYRRFCNKIYQATKFALLRLGADFVPKASGEKTGKESLAERWILHKLNQAAKEVNAALEAREFNIATQAVYRYWWNELCDVYIETSKLLILEGTPEQKRSAQDTLYTALNGALCMVHPFMPFVTEELWQRLPRRPNDANQTIVKAAFPVYTPALDDRAAAEAYGTVLAVAEAIRSLQGEYEVKDAAQIYVAALEAAQRELVTAEVPTILSLVKGVEKIEVLGGAEVPEGCGVAPVSKNCNVYLLVKGRIDVDAEVKKTLAKLNKTDEAIGKQEKLIGAEDYKAKVRASVQRENQERLDTMRAERETLATLVEKLKNL